MGQTSASLSIASQKYRTELTSRISKKLPLIKSKIVKLFMEGNKIQQIAEKAIAVKKFENINIRSLSMVFSEVLKDELGENKFEAIKNLSKSDIFDKGDTIKIIKSINDNKNIGSAELWKLSGMSEKSEYKTFYAFSNRLKKQINEKGYEYVKNLYL